MSATPQKQPVALRPKWVAKDHELWLGEVLVHRFKHSAPVAELILAAFEEQGWPDEIDDPLHPKPGRSEKVRLRNAIHALQRRLINPVISFESDGYGKGIRWRLK